MSTESHSGQPPAASQREGRLWQQVAAAVDALCAAWDSHLTAGADQPNLAKFLPPAGHGDDKDSDKGLRALALPELIKADLKYRWQHDLSPRKLESYTQEFSLRDSSGQLPMELIHEELQVRMQAGRRVTEEEIHERFPQQAPALCDLVGGMAVSGTQTETYFVETEQGTKLQTDVMPTGNEAVQFAPGQQVDDFQLLTKLGEGAFAQVFLARQVSMERLVALKISSQQGTEPQTLAQLDHANVVRVFDQRQSGAGAVRLLYMEVVPGGTLQSVVQLIRRTSPAARTGKLLLTTIDEKLAARGSAPPEGSPGRNWLSAASWPMAVCQIGAQLADGLAYAHAKGVLHRDIKPANVLLTPSGTPKLADFNVSYNCGRADEDPSDTFGGSLIYMSPEQLQACNPVLGGSPQMVRQPSDIFSLGVLLWELLCGTRPFDDDLQGEEKLAKIQRMIDRRHYADFQELAQQLPADCPESLRQVLLRCLQPRQNERYPAAEEVARDLKLCLYPRTWKMMQPATNPISRLVLAAPLLGVIVASLVPNLLILAFKLYYYRVRMAELKPDLSERFDTILIWVNGFAFPIGLVIGLTVAARTVRLVTKKNLERSNEAGGRVLFFGLFISLLTLSLWTVAGLIYPVALNLSLEIKEALSFYGHFFATLALCGFAAMAYPYFSLTALAVRCFFPAMVRNNMVLGPCWNDLQRLRMWNRVHLALAGLVPMLAVILVTSSGSENTGTLLVVSGGGVVGFVALFALERLIDGDLTALERIAVDAPHVE